jgi:hypothetical protein
MAVVSRPRQKLYVVCSWCRQPAPGQQLRLWESPDETTHTICDSCFAKVSEPEPQRR